MSFVKNKPCLDAKMRSLYYIQGISTAYIQTRGGRLFVGYASPKGTELLFVKAKPNQIEGSETYIRLLLEKVTQTVQERKT